MQCIISSGHWLADGSVTATSRVALRKELDKGRSASHSSSEEWSFHVPQQKSCGEETWSRRAMLGASTRDLAEAEPRDEPPAMDSLGEEEASISRTDAPALLKKPWNRPLVTHRLSSQFPEAKERKFSVNLVHYCPHSFCSPIREEAPQRRREETKSF